ncbi:hypothetical protein NQ315_015210 [Exocentrus adspersus]|uniref:DUF4817 domain-containing protein n=1 Tax=Exocentrus adspersus TaxID=1586481 RepID=A0AAV8VWE4_9CUCU|nr:hypothetical protein NQ315_015210 [Exocentrus adspersus]
MTVEEFKEILHHAIKQHTDELVTEIRILKQEIVNLKESNIDMVRLLTKEPYNHNHDDNSKLNDSANSNTVVKSDIANCSFSSENTIIQKVSRNDGKLNRKNYLEGQSLAKYKHSSSQKCRNVVDSRKFVIGTGGQESEDDHHANGRKQKPRVVGFLQVNPINPQACCSLPERPLLSADNKIYIQQVNSAVLEALSATTMNLLQRLDNTNTGNPYAEGGDVTDVFEAVDLLHHNGIHHTAICFNIPIKSAEATLDTEDVVYDFCNGNYAAIIDYYVRQKKGSTRIPSNVSLEDDQFKDPHAIVNGFANYFSSVFSTDVADNHIALPDLNYQYKPHEEVCRIFNELYTERPPISRTVGKTIQRFEETGNVKNKPKLGRPKTATTQEKQLDVLLAIAESHHFSTRQVARDLEISQTSIRMVLKNVKYHPYKIQLVQELSDDSTNCKCKVNCININTFLEENQTEAKDPDYDDILTYCFLEEKLPYFSVFILSDGLFHTVRLRCGCHTIYRLRYFASHRKLPEPPINEDNELNNEYDDPNKCKEGTGHCIV